MTFLSAINLFNHRANDRHLIERIERTCLLVACIAHLCATPLAQNSQQMHTKSRFTVIPCFLYTNRRNVSHQAFLCASLAMASFIACIKRNALMHTWIILSCAYKKNVPHPAFLCASSAMALSSSISIFLSTKYLGILPAGLVEGGPVYLTGLGLADAAVGTFTACSFTLALLDSTKSESAGLRACFGLLVYMCV